MEGIATNFAEVRQRMEAACRRVGREPSDVELVAVSKTFPVSDIAEAVKAGQLVFGESRLQEAEPKIDALPASLCWHFIGSVQRNKVRKILQKFAVIHAIDSLRLAEYVNGIACELGNAAEVFLQVNVGGEASKGGFEAAVLRQEIGKLCALEHLRILGLMCIPPAGPDAESARRWFVSLRELRDELQTISGRQFSKLSMGMSGDYEVAIEEGATHVRVGSLIFGHRSRRVEGELG
ncbi:MAG: YggS family pyridoxal phosphate-dependent enzyme [Verrucomicrobia bacterium]|nr:YggS family pyridoxal phosphate-dependent enzyme [Verrucomicrobiota bacterium]